MDRSDVARVVASIGLPYVYKVWAADKAGSVPYPHLRYSRERTDRLVADDRTYLHLDEYELLLVSESKDECSEAAVETALEAAGIVASDTQETWIQDERLFQVSWTFQVIR